MCAEAAQGLSMCNRQRALGISLAAAVRMRVPACLLAEPHSRCEPRLVLLGTGGSGWCHRSGLAQLCRYFNDLWAFDLEELSWQQLSKPGTVGPRPRGGCQMVVHQVRW